MDKAGVVEAFAVAASDPEFRPTIETPIGDIELNATTMAEIRQQPSRICYSVGGTGGFGYMVFDSFDGQCNAYRYTDVHWGRFYARSPEPEIATLILNDKVFAERVYSSSGEQVYSSSFDPYRSQWPINVVMLNHELSDDAVRTFAIASELESYRVQPVK